MSDAPDARIDLLDLRVPYALVRRAMADQGLTHYPMSLTSAGEKRAVLDAVSQGIDAHLEACHVPERGDSYQAGERSITATRDSPHWKKGTKLVLAVTLECRVSAESLPVLLRRLGELGADGDDEFDGEGGESLAYAILETLGIDEFGHYRRPEE